MRIASALIGGTLLFLAALVQVTILAPVSLFGGTPDLLLVALVAVALLRGSVFGAAGGFFAGLIVDTATLQPLGQTSLLLTLAGYWTGRYGETTGRDRAHAPLVAVGVVTVLYVVGAFALRFVLGEEPSFRTVFVDSLLPSVLLNLLLATPVYAACRRALRAAEPRRPPHEVRLLG
jgi:rod shape-determining protein MreD